MARIFSRTETVISDERRFHHDGRNERSQQNSFDYGGQPRHRPGAGQRSLKRGAKRVYAASRVSLQIADERVTTLTLDVTSASQIQHAVDQVGTLDILINNAGIAADDDLTNPAVVEQHLAVNLLGPLKVTNAFVPLLKRSRGTVVNNLSLAALAALPMIPAYSISKAAAFNMSQSLRALLTVEGVSVRAVILGPIDTEMSRGLEIPKASPECAAAGIFDGLEKGEDEIFPDPTSAAIADAWRNGAVKTMKRQFAAFVPQPTADDVP